MTKIKKVTLKSGESRYKFNVYLGVDKVTGKKKRTSRSYKTLREAQIELRKLQLMGLEKATQTINKYTYKDVYLLWLENHKNEIRGTTLASKESKFNKRILPKFGRMPIKEISRVYCQTVVNEWANEMKAFNDYVIQARLVFNYAMKLELIDSNPMEYITLPSRKENKVFIEKDRNFLTKEELKLFMQYLDQENKLQTTCLFRLLAFTGMRKGEVLALHWSDINFKSKDLYVQKTLAKVNNKHILQPPKTRESYRWLDIDEITIQLLKEWKREQVNQYKEYGFEVAKDKDQPIFATYHTRLNQMKYMRVSTPNDKLEAFFNRHKDLHKIHVHGFRHTHASLLFESGAKLKDVQSRLGHSDIKTTMDIYTHITQSSREKLAEDFHKYIDF
ncbi:MULTISPECIES: tyrosine-type recombinase/integrase [Staphylococcaceae]|uniref:Integrase n=1 Tax=Macrococcoides caseolyticum TaxID=69966 RepID=A0A1S7BGV3_9STAP|nr:MULTISPECIES: site-specific integrase [Macrococcus]AQX82863.1 integrase [Macrococcus caseolyticus]AQX82904.1 integrase [Macrococcus caseolyticus]ARQ03560.1 integrase [Macrococcus caseolyticus]MCO4095873.1 site-specific integrase [Macrococcus canis]PKE11834.1 site-specific integrase [Macrococcus caseolyticus]